MQGLQGQVHASPSHPQLSKARRVCNEPPKRDQRPHCAVAGSVGRGDSVAVWVGMKVTVTLQEAGEHTATERARCQGKGRHQGKGVMNHSLTNQFRIGLSHGSQA